MPEDRYAPLIRALVVYRMLRSKALTLVELGAVLEMHPRSARRLLDAMMAAGFPITVSRRKQTTTYQYKARRLP